MTVKSTIAAAQQKIYVRCVILRNPFIKTLLYIGTPANMPPQLYNKNVISRLYDPNKQRLILRVNA